MLSIKPRSFVAIGEFEVVQECAVGGEFCRLGGFGLLGIGPGPRIFAEDAEGAGVGHLGEAVGAVDALGDVEAEVAELRGGEADVHVIGIGEVDLVVVPDVAGVGEDVAAAGGEGLDGMRAEDPVADVDDVDVLFEQDVAGEGAVPEPVAEARFIGGHAGLGVVHGGGRVVVGGDAGEFAERAGVDAA